MAGTKSLADALGGGSPGGLDSTHTGPLPIFQRAVVHEVIFDPKLLSDEKVEELRSQLRFTHNIRDIPRNSVIGERIRNGQTEIAGKEVFFPMFSPHLALPVKAGEHVWVMFEDPGMTDAQGFWVSRISEIRSVDDINHTHADRKFDRRAGKTTAEKAAGASQPVPGFNNGVIGQLDGEDVPIGGTGSISGGPDAYKKIIKNSESGKITDYEAVPRFSKRPGDFAIQGSNNTLIVLGTDRTSSAAIIGDDGHVKKRPDGDKVGKAGAVVISVGRGQKSKTSGKKIKNALDREELDKSHKNESPTEGDFDFENDSVTVYLSMKTDADTNFGVKHTKHTNTSRTEASAAVVKADQIRIVARDDIKFLVKASADTPDDMCAMFVVSREGNIIFIPGNDGFIKLGGDDADIAILGTRAGVSKSGGRVSASPIIDTMGGSQGGSDGLNGTFATKVLMK